jgi:hypothetical protein
MAAFLRASVTSTDASNGMSTKSARQDVVVAEAQLRDDHARLGKPFTFDAYLLLRRIAPQLRVTGITLSFD